MWYLGLGLPGLRVQGLVYGLGFRDSRPASASNVEA